MSERENSSVDGESAAPSADVKVEETDVVGLHSNDLANSIDIWALGVTTVIGGQYYGWNVAFEAGAGCYVFSQLLVGIAYVFYCSCVAEIVGAISFSGGAYGLSRVTLGFYFGFIVGIAELLEYIAYTSVSVVWLGSYITEELHLDSRWQFVIWFLLYCVFLGVFSKGGRHMWNFFIVLAIASVLPIIIYSLACLQYTDFDKYARHETGQPWFRGSFANSFFGFLPYTTWAFGGIESLALATSLCKAPKISLPRGMISSVLTLFICIMLLVFIVPSLPPGINSSIEALYPLNAGFELAMDLSAPVAKGLILPAQLGMAMGFVLPYGKLLQSMADSNLVPFIFGLQKQKSLLKSMIFGSIIGYLLCILAFFSSSFNYSLQNICVLAACLTYFAQLAGFIVLRTTFSSVERNYISPFGIPGAIFAFVVFILIFLSIIGGFQHDNGIAAIVVLVIICVVSAYYFWFAQSFQTLCPEEHKYIFRFNVIKFNRRKFHAQRRGSKTAMQMILGKVGISKENVDAASSRFASFSTGSSKKSLGSNRSASRLQIVPVDALGGDPADRLSTTSGTRLPLIRFQPPDIEQSQTGSTKIGGEVRSKTLPIPTGAGVDGRLAEFSSSISQLMMNSTDLKPVRYGAREYAHIEINGGGQYKSLSDDKWSKQLEFAAEKEFLHHDVEEFIYEGL